MGIVVWPMWILTQSTETTACGENGAGLDLPNKRSNFGRRIHSSEDCFPSLIHYTPSSVSHTALCRRHPAAPAAALVRHS